MCNAFDVSAALGCLASRVFVIQKDFPVAFSLGVASSIQSCAHSLMY